MSDTMTPQGSESLTVEQAASNLLQMMNDAEDSQEQPQAEEQPVVEAQAEEDYSDEYDSDDSESNDEEVQETPRYRVKVDGQETEVQLDELIRGYQREADYTKKTQTLAEQRKAVEAEKAAVEQAKQLRDQYAQRLQLIEQTLSKQSPAEDLEALKEVDPIGYAVKVAERSEQEKKLAVLRAEQARIAQMQQAEQAEQIKKVVASEAEKLTQLLPEYADPQKGEQVRKDIRTYAEKIGFSSQELAQVYDSRAVLTLYKAMQYDKLMANKGEVNKKVEQAPKMLKSGVGRPTTSIEAETTKKMKQQLRSSGKVSDAAKLFEKFL
jgi:hypothetical protein